MNEPYKLLNEKIGMNLKIAISHHTTTHHMMLVSYMNASLSLYTK